MYRAQRTQCGMLLGTSRPLHTLNLLSDCPCANACCMLGSTTNRVVISPSAATIATIDSAVLLFIILLLAKANIYKYIEYIVKYYLYRRFAMNIVTLINNINNN